MRRALGSVCLSAIVAVALFIGKEAADPTAVHACGWYLEHQGSTVSKSFYSVYIGGSNYLNEYINTYNDGCGDKYYTLHNYTTYYEPGTFQSSLSVWVCGSYTGRNYTSSSTTVSTPSFYYGSCGRSANDTGDGTWFYSSWNGQTITPTFVAYA